MGGGVRHARIVWRVLRVSACLVLFLPWIFTASASAGAWTRPAGEGLILSSLSHHEFDLGADGFGYAKLESAVYLEYGLTDRFTLVGRLSQETRFHQSRVALNKRGSVIRLSVNKVSAALGDSELGMRTRLLSSEGWTLSAQTSLVRFSVEPNPLLNAEARWGLDNRLMIGRSLGERTFAEAQLAHRADWTGGREEMRLDLTLGLRPAERWMVMAQTYSAWGEARWSAYPYRYDSHRVHLSVIAPVREGLSLQLGVINSVSTDRMAPERAYMVSLWREF